MNLPKAFDGPSLVKALEAVGISDGIDLLIKGVGVVGDWVNSSFDLNAADGSFVGKIEEFAKPGVNYAVNLMVTELTKVQASLTAAANPAPAAAPASTPAPAAAPAAPAAAPATPATPAS